MIYFLQYLKVMESWGRLLTSRFLPTLGESDTTGISRASKSLLGPIPLSSNNFGESMKPAEIITSPFARSGGVSQYVT